MTSPSRCATGLGGSRDRDAPRALRQIDHCTGQRINGGGWMIPVPFSCAVSATPRVCLTARTGGRSSHSNWDRRAGVVYIVPHLELTHPATHASKATLPRDCWEPSECSMTSYPRDRGLQVGSMTYEHGNRDLASLATLVSMLTPRQWLPRAAQGSTRP